MPGYLALLRVVIAGGRIILDELHLHLCSDATS
jgi:hypothetical protein